MSWHHAASGAPGPKRAVGFRLHRTGLLLADFVGYPEENQRDTITTDSALAWASLPLNGSLEWWGYRLSAVRVFARHLHTIDPCHEVPPTGLWIGSCRPGNHSPFSSTSPR